MYRPLTLLFIMQGAFTASCTKSYLKVNVKNNPAVIANESGNGDNGGANANVAPTISHNCAMQVNTGSTYSCRLDVIDENSGDTPSLSSPVNTCSWLTLKNFSLSGTPASHDIGICQIEIIASDGTADSPPTTLNFEVKGATTVTSVQDLTKPSLSFQLVPPAMTVLPSTFTFSASDNESAISQYLCSLDGSAYSVCASPHPVTGLAAGRHTLSVKAINANQLASDPGSYSWVQYSSKVMSIPFNHPGSKGLGSDDVRRVFARGNSIYASNYSGLSISHDGGQNFVTITQSSGLQYVTIIKDAVIDAQNVLYVATDSGLYRSTDGGSTFSKKTTADGLGHNNVDDIFIDSNNHIYVSTFNGVSISTNGGVSFENKTAGLGSSDVNHVFVRNSKIYAATAAGISISTDAGATFNHTPIANIYGLYVDTTENVYLSTGSGLRVSTDGGANYSLKTTLNGLPSNTVVAAYSSGSNLYAGSPSGLAISTDMGNTFTTTNPLGTAYVSDIYVDGGVLYVATDTGLYISADAGVSFTQKKAQAIPPKVISSIFVDSAGSIYAGTGEVSGSGGNGLAISEDGGASFKTKTTTEGLPGNNINDVFVSNDRVVYVATHDGLGISIDNGNSFQVKTTVNGLGNNIVRRVLSNPSGTIFAGTDGGLSISTNGGNSFTNKTTVNGLSSDSISALHFDSNLNRLYVGTNGGGMQISTDNGATFLPAMTSMTHGLGSDQIYTIYRAPNGTLYVGTSGGLSISTDNGSSFVNRTGADGLDGNDVISVAVGADGAIYAAIDWGNLSVSTDGGVTFTTWSQAEGFLSPNGVFSVYSDLNGRTYFGQEYGWLHVRQ